MSDHVHEMPNRGDFQRTKGDSFSIRLEGEESVDLRLSEIDDRGNITVSGEPIECYALLFHGPTDVLMAQGTYWMENESLGRFPLFIVPLGPDDEGMQYQAVFN